MPKIAYFDCLSGISGDMTLGALVDAGAEIAAIEAAVRSMGLPELTITCTEVKKHGFRAIKVDIGHPPEHAHRHLHHITDMIDGATEIEPEAKELAKKIFHQVAVAEAKVHGSTLQKVHFHEVGAIDSIADIVGAAVAMTSMGIEIVEASPVPTGTGSITIAHGKVSIPAPATAEILKGVPIAASSVECELTTPTGAAILKACARRFGPLPSMTMHSIGFGAGTKDLESQANVLRVIVGEVAASERSASNSIQRDEIMLLETNIDDCTAEQIADAAERLMDAGALDVIQTPCQMKKGRSGVSLSVIANIDQAASLEAIMFESTSTIGIRRQVIPRHKLSRTDQVVATAFGEVSGKAVTLPSGQQRFKPEYDLVSQIAKRANVSLADVVSAAQTAWSDNR
ncbi:hypothetical protein Pla22_22170 [Rubripirellula amarantea]|uniref:Putative nickel insertion protein n=1 Tax=Rubripirellula amarantea TaxID=2527999 RepID=A0A5C5WV01_9BACT|nr:nickel pincer cofactor biosynthesis protein LarC [Rubripirellula amarantea]TWT54567.1 hypothetical protein Pla22_22170 [Rubripirellula amarantea]